jgi:hypothetical protein
MRRPGRHHRLVGAGLRQREQRPELGGGTEEVSVVDPMASSQSGSFERRPVTSMIRSEEISSPSIVGTPVTCGIPPSVDGYVSIPTMEVPRRTERSLSATRANAYSMAGGDPLSL